MSKETRLAPEETDPLAYRCEMERRKSYTEWVDLLCESFFHPEKGGRAVFFFVDDEVLARLAGTTPPEAVRDLVAAVSSRMVASSNPFERIWHETFRWKRQGGLGCPPSLPLLALTVLAATMMARGEGFAPHNYHSRFRQLIGQEGSGAAPGYAETIPDLWRWLHWWLEEKNKGRLGRSTITPSRRWTNIGYALSQALFREADRQRLTEFFDWFGLEPGAEFHPDELWRYFRVWMERYGRMGRGVWRMLDDPAYENQLREIVVQEASTWDGVGRDDEGRLRIPLHLTLVPFPRPSIGFAARAPARAPDQVDFRGNTRVSLRRLTRDWYEPIPLPGRPADILAHGLTLRNRDVTATYEPQQIVLFRQEQSLGSWVSVPRLIPGDPHYVLVERPSSGAARTFLETYAEEPPRVRNLPDLPQWVLIGDVTINSPVIDSVEPPLQQLVPRVGWRPAFVGGLELDRRVYLQGGEPDLWIPPTDGLVDEVTIGNLRIAVQREGGTIQLREAGLRAGTHQVVVGPTRLQISTIETTGRSVSEAAGSLGYRLRTDAGFVLVAGGPAEVASDPPDEREIIITGARILARTGMIAGESRPPILLPRGAREYRLVGPRAGQVHVLHEPERPAWMRRVRMHPHGFDVVPSFPVVWVLIHSRTGWIVRLCDPLEPTAGSTSNEEEVRLWQGCFALSVGPLPPEASELWERYARVARSLG